MSLALEAEMPTDIVTLTPINLSDKWSKVARERIRLKQDDIRSPGFCLGIPMHLITNHAKADIWDEDFAQVSILDLSRWSGNGHYSHRSGWKVHRGNDYWNSKISSTV